MKLGFIGCGNMASAIINGVVSSENIDASNIYVYDVFYPAIEKITSQQKVNICESEKDIVKNCDTVILAVKPNVLSSVLNTINTTLEESETLLISIAAGKTLDFLRSNLSHNNKIIRVMPNINAKVNQSISAYCCNEQVTKQDKQVCESILSAIGQVMFLEENQFPLFGVIGGCGPAMAFMFIDALARAGVKNGMKKDVALMIAAQTVYGSAKMIMDSNQHPWELVDQVCSPGGTTIEAVTSLQEYGLDTAIHTAVDKALNKDSKL